MSPFRNSVPRKKAPVGSQAAHWKAIRRINAGRANPFIPFGQAGPKVQTEVLEFSAAYRPIALDDSVIMDAQMLAQGFEDLRATAGINLLYALMIEEDRLLLGGQPFALPKPAQPVLTANVTGGSIPASTTVHVRVRARTLENWFFGGGSELSDDATVQTGAGSTNSVTATVDPVRGAVAYDWYVSGDGTTYFYAGTTTVESFNLEAVPTADAATPSLPDLAPADTYQVAAQGDRSADPNAFAGLLATIAGDYLNGTYVTPGKGEPSGGIWTSLKGAPLTADGGQIVEFSDIFVQLWDQVRLAPTKILVSGREAANIAKIVAKSGNGGGAAYTIVQPTGTERASLIAGYAVQEVLHPITRRPIPLEVMPHLPPGTAVIITEVLPYPNNAVANVFEVETQQEYQQLEYAMARQEGPGGGPRYDLEVRAIEVFKNYFPAGCAVITGIGE
ncbi:MAG: hypothetical protein IRZ18_08550 [Clostridia bacterium]|nr:hypothetical protein [Clostridia bacterium]